MKDTAGEGPRRRAALASSRPTYARRMMGGSAGRLLGSMRQRGEGKGGSARWSAPWTGAGGGEVGGGEERPWRPGGRLP
jgi:hypothetical protein